jgi:hypothetical protein
VKGDQHRWEDDMRVRVQVEAEEGGPHCQRVGELGGLCAFSEGEPSGGLPGSEGIF